MHKTETGFINEIGSYASSIVASRKIFKTIIVTDTDDQRIALSESIKTDDIGMPLPPSHFRCRLFKKLIDARGA